MATQTGQPGIPELGRAVLDDVRRLAQLEVQLAKEEMLASVKRLVIDVVLFAVAGLLVVYGVAYALLAVAWRLDLLVHWWGWVVAGGALFIVAALIAGVGVLRLRRTLRRTKGAITEIKGDAEWLKQLPQRAKSSS